MLIDASDLSDTPEIESDVCVIGGGAAGLVLAYEVQSVAARVVLLESGGLKREKQSNALISGANIGTSDFALGGRRRRLGGGLNDWGANCSLLDPEDFENIQCDGLLDWPIGYGELASVSSRAEKYLGCSDEPNSSPLSDTSRPYAAQVLDGEARGGQTASLSEKLYVRGESPALQYHRTRLLERSCPVSVILHATVTELKFDATGSVVSAAAFSSHSGKRGTVRAKLFILAAGVENAPILLRSLRNDGNGSERRLPALGRKLHSHLVSVQGFYVPARKDLPLARYMLPADHGTRRKTRITRFYGLQVPAAHRRNEQMLNTAMFLAPVFRDSKRISDGTLRRTTRAFSIPIWQRLAFETIMPESLRGFFTPNAFAILHFMEQPARWDASVTLGRLKTAAKVAEPIYRWGIGDEERRTMTKNCRYLGEVLSSAGLGSVYLDGEDYRVDKADLGRNAHPMGGTVMGTDAKTSVVDTDLRVHGFDNLFVCGGSAIPRSGAAMVTGVILQLAIRLADYLRDAVAHRI